MNKTEALERLNHLQIIVEAADSIGNVSWSDIAPVEKLAIEMRVRENPDVQKAIEVLQQGLMYVNGRRRGITWTQVYNLFAAMNKAIKAMP